MEVLGGAPPDQRPHFFPYTPAIPNESELLFDFFQQTPYTIGILEEINQED